MSLWVFNIFCGRVAGAALLRFAALEPAIVNVAPQSRLVLCCWKVTISLLNY